MMTLYKSLVLLKQGSNLLVRGLCNSRLGNIMVHEGIMAILITVEGHKANINYKWASRQTMHLLSFDKLQPRVN